MHLFSCGLQATSLLTLAASVNRTRPQCPSPCLAPQNARPGFVRADPGWSWGLIHGPRPLGKSKETVTSLRLMEKSEAVWLCVPTGRSPHPSAPLTREPQGPGPVLSRSSLWFLRRRCPPLTVPRPTSWSSFETHFKAAFSVSKPK